MGAGPKDGPGVGPGGWLDIARLEGSYPGTGCSPNAGNYPGVIQGSPGFTLSLSVLLDQTPFILSRGAFLAIGSKNSVIWEFI